MSVHVHRAEAKLDTHEVDLLVKYTGRVNYFPHKVFKSGCLIDITNYPFDVQTCDLWIQSASRPTHQLGLVPYHKAPLDLDTYLGSFKDAQVQ